MATKPVMLPSGPARREFWAEFQRVIADRVRECNIEAGEGLWRIVRPGDALDRVVVERIGESANRIECAFDEHTRALICIPGPAVDAPALRFEWAAGTLVLEGRSYGFAIPDALTLILDELVVADEE